MSKRQELINYLREQEDVFRTLRRYVEEGRETEAPFFMLDGYDMTDYEEDVRKMLAQEELNAEHTADVEKGEKPAA